MMQLQMLLKLVIISGITRVLSMSSGALKFIRPMVKGGLMSLSRPLMMAVMSIPEQLIVHLMEPGASVLQRLMVSVAMFAIHFAWNGLVMKPERSYNELVWILGTAAFAVYVLEMKMKTGVALIAADSVMTLAMRGL